MRFDTFGGTILVGVVIMMSEEMQKIIDEESQKRIEEIQSEKNTAEDRLNYETNRIELQMQSRFSGMAKKYSQTLGLEIDGIEDILEYISNDQARDAIQERINRMRNIISEIGE